MTDVQSSSQQQHRRNNRSGSLSDADEVVDYLQLAGRRYREHVELLRQEQAVREAQHAPFKPTISAYAEQASKTSVVRQGSSIGNRLHELHQKKLAILAEEAAESARRREAEERSVCTFTPAVTAMADRTLRRHSNSNSDDDRHVSALLLRWEERRRARQVRQQAEATRREWASVTGVPRISAYAVEKAAAERQRRTVPIEASLLAEAEARRRRQHAAFEQSYATSSTAALTVDEEDRRHGYSHTQRRAGASPPPSFVPAISSYAAQIQFQQGVVDRLYTYHRTQQQQNGPRSHSRGYDEEMELHCTFQPQLSPQCAALSKLYYDDEGEASASNPHDRLYRNAHHPSKYRKSMLPDTGTGQPIINDASRRIVEERRRQLASDGDPGALGHSPGSRLYPNTTAPDKKRQPTFKKKVVTARDVELQTALTFAPAVSPTSEAMWRHRVTALKASGAARNTDEARQLLWRKAERKKEEEVARMQAQRRREEAAACTFHPKAGRPPHRRSGYIAMPIEARTTLWARQRDARLRDLRAEAEASAVEECSFHPHIDPVFPLPRQDAALATGVEAFVERQAEARRLREEAKEWWRPQYARKSIAVNRSKVADVADASVAGRVEDSSLRRNGTPALPYDDDDDGDGDGDVPLSSQRESHEEDDESAEVREHRISTDGYHAEGDEEEEVFVQHWASWQPPSTSLTASSFSHVSQADVPSAESSPRQRAYVVQQPAATSAGPYRWKRSSTLSDTANQPAASPTPLSWRKPLRYRAR